MTLGWVVPRFADLTAGRVYTAQLTWVSQLDLVFDLRLDGLAATMTLIVAAVGVLVLWYAHGYFATDTPILGRLAGLLVLFAGAMVGLVQSNNFYMFYMFWELTSVTSFLLIGINHTQTRARAAALHAFVVTSAGGLAMLAGFVLVNTETGASTFTQLADAPSPTGTVITVAHGAAPHRRVHEVGAVPVPRLAARRDGGADAGQRVPPLRDHGDRRCLPRRPPRAGLRDRLACGGRSCSPWAASRSSPAACARCANTTPS